MLSYLRNEVMRNFMASHIDGARYAMWHFEARFGCQYCVTGHEFRQYSYLLPKQLIEKFDGRVSSNIFINSKTCQSDPSRTFSMIDLGMDLCSVIIHQHVMIGFTTSLCPTSTISGSQRYQRIAWTIKLYLLLYASLRCI